MRPLLIKQRITMKSLIQEKNISPLREYINALTLSRADLIVKSTNVLEIGCGSVDTFKKIVIEKEGYWFGLDPKGDIATHKGSVNRIPFDNNTFDLIICSQSIEHWYEFHTTFDDGLSEIHRVLKTGGRLCLDFPLFLHGHPVFMLGKKEKIRAIFNTPSWTVEKEDCYIPAEPYYTWEGKRKKYADEWLCQIILKQKNTPSHIVSFLLKRAAQKYAPLNSESKQRMERIWFILLENYKHNRRKIDSLLNKVSTQSGREPCLGKENL